MADLAQTAASVHAHSGASIRLVQAGESITPGQPVYKLAADGKYYKAVATSEAPAVAEGIALGYAPADTNWFPLLYDGDIDLGATLAIGQTYVVSANAAGAIALESDLGTGEYVTILGVATAADKLALKIQATGITHA